MIVDADHLLDDADRLILDSIKLCATTREEARSIRELVALGHKHFESSRQLLERTAPKRR